MILRTTTVSVTRAKYSTRCPVYTVVVTSALGAGLRCYR